MMPDYGIPPELPCCGIAVLCYVLNKKFKHMYLEIKKTHNKNDDWYGGMSLPELLLVLVDNIVDFEEYTSKQTLYQYAKENNSLCIINTCGHFQIYKNGMVFDQKGWRNVFDSEHKHQKIVKIVKII